MYQDYIDGKRELKDINMSFSANYVMGDQDRGSRGECSGVF